MFNDDRSLFVINPILSIEEFSNNFTKTACLNPFFVQQTCSSNPLLKSKWFLKEEPFLISFLKNEFIGLAITMGSLKKPIIVISKMIIMSPNPGNSPGIISSIF